MALPESPPFQVLRSTWPPAGRLSRALDAGETLPPKEIHRRPVDPARGGWGVLVSPGDTLANPFQKSFRGFLTTPLPDPAASPAGSKAA